MHQSGVNGLSAAAVPSQAVAANSGVNGCPLSARVILATAGDDQSLCFSVLKFTIVRWSEMGVGLPDAGAGTEGDSGELHHCCCEKIGQAREADAHSSAVRDVWTDGSAAFSIGLDQRVRKWALHLHATNQANQQQQGGGGLPTPPSSARSDECCFLEYEEVGVAVVQVLEPQALDVVGTSDEGYRVAVGGRGLQVLTWQSEQREENNKIAGRE